MRLTVRGFNGEEITVDAVVDTGFSDFVALTDEQVQALNLLPSNEVFSTLADGTTRTVLTYFASVEWDGIPVLIEVVGGDADPLVGMALLEGYNLSMDVVEGGAVRITRLGGELIPATEDAP